MTAVEIIATVCGLICVWLTIRQDIWCWPVGLIQVGLYVGVFYHAKLYSDVILHVIYVGMQVYGWIHWLRGGQRADALPITRLSPAGITACIVILFTATVGIGWTMSRYTDAALPHWDASIMVLSLIAQFLLARKVLESWLLWIGVDVLAVGVYTVKQLYVTTGLYAVFFCMAVAGWFAWQRSFREQKERVYSGAAKGLCSESLCPRTVGTSS